MHVCIICWTKESFGGKCKYISDCSSQYKIEKEKIIFFYDKTNCWATRNYQVYWSLKNNT